MSWRRTAILMAAAAALAGCATNYGKLYPLPLHYRYGVPQSNVGTGPLPVPQGGIPVRPKTWQNP